MGRERVPADWPALTEREARQLLARVPGLTGASAAHLVWHSPRPFAAAAIVALPSRQVVVKRHSAEVRSVASLEAEHAFVRHLVAGGVAAPLAFNDGTSSAWAEAGFVYEVQEALSGHDLYADAPSWTPFTGSDHAASAGAELARLHLTSAGYAAPARPVEPLFSSACVATSADPVGAAEALADKLPGLASYLALVSPASTTPWRRQLSLALAPFREASVHYAGGLDPLWAHNDWHPSNLLWSSSGRGARVAGVIDFGLANLTSACYDLATALERTAVSWLDPPELRPVHADHASALLAGYSAVRRLPEVEAAALPHLLPVVHVDYALSEVDYFWRVVGSRANADAAWEEYLLGHLQWWAGPEGRELLSRVARAASGAV